MIAKPPLGVNSLHALPHRFRAGYRRLIVLPNRWNSVCYCGQLCCSATCGKLVKFLCFASDTPARLRAFIITSFHKTESLEH